MAWCRPLVDCWSANKGQNLVACLSVTPILAIQRAASTHAHRAHFAAAKSLSRCFCLLLPYRAALWNRHFTPNRAPAQVLWITPRVTLTSTHNQSQKK